MGPAMDPRNREIVPKREYEAIMLEEGDKLEIVQFVRALGSGFQVVKMVLKLSFDPPHSVC